METVVKSKRIFYLDALRALAILCVMIVHVYAITRFIVKGDYGSFQWFFSQLWGNPFRIGVDLFLMLSGALSLGRKWDIRTFLGKRIPRIIEPFLFWNLILFGILLICSYLGYSHFLTSFDLGSISNALYNTFFVPSGEFRPNWFFWMILGTYLIMPIFNKWLLHCDMKEVEYFLVIWLVTCIFDFTINKECPIKLTYFTSPIGLVVLGYYLRHTKRKIYENKYFVLLLILIPAIIVMLIAYVYSTPTKMVYSNRYSFFLAVEVAGVFLLFRNYVNNINEDGIVYKFIFSLAKYSYGIYLFHYFLIYRLFDFLRGGYTPLVMIILLVSTIVICLCVMAVLNSVPYLNKIIGAK